MSTGKRGMPVICGGIATMLHAEETALHTDALFLGEAEGRMEQVFDDFRNNRLRKVYDYLTDFPPIASVGTARRDILKRELYNYQGRPDGRSCFMPRGDAGLTAIPAV